MVVVLVQLGHDLHHFGQGGQWLLAILVASVSKNKYLKQGREIHTILFATLPERQPGGDGEGINFSI